MDLEVKDNPAESRFEAEVDGMLSVAEYRLEGETLTLMHTEVPASLRGKGVGEQVARGVLDAARERGLKVVPKCRYIASFIKRNPEYEDLLE